MRAGMVTRRRGIRPVDQLIAPAIAETLRSLPDEHSATDAGARKLIEQYAESIDGAAIMSDLAYTVLEQTEPGDVYVRKALDAVIADVEHRKVLAELGPKMLAALDAVGGTWAGRAKATKTTGPAQPATKSRLELLQEQHAKDQHVG